MNDESYTPYREAAPLKDGPTQVSGSMDKLSEQVKYAMDRALLVEGRLRPVLRATDQDAETNTVPMAVFVPLAEQIRSVEGDVNRVVNILQGIIDRLEL